MKLRHEFKHKINFFDYLSIKPRLQAILQPDIKASQTGIYTVRSLYFDNYDNKVLREKFDGVNMREKFRLRYYNDCTDFIRLEKKSKINGLCGKQSELITKEQCKALLEGDYRFLKESDKPLFLELYHKMVYQQLRPKTIVEYTREAYIYPAGNVRLTIDSNIRTGLVSIDFFNDALVTVIRPEIIFEVKFDEFLPQIISDMIQINNRKTTSFSKYAACRII